jgi:PTH1 family peptidyl-tRNA hydrolase
VSTKLIAGLGNPEERYRGTRHNLGWEIVEEIARRLDASWSTSTRIRSAVATGRWRGERVVLLKPLTYMNLSGDAVAPAMRFHDVEPGDLLVVVDDVALPLGRMRFRPSGSSGGHNGLRDIERALGTRDYGRLRVGVGQTAHGGGDGLVGHVLGRFSKEESRQVAELLPDFADAALAWVESGMREAMNRFNRKEQDSREDDES